MKLKKQRQKCKDYSGISRSKMYLTKNRLDNQSASVYLDADEYSDKEDGDGKKEEKHEEPGAPVQPVTETHHAHVLLQ